MSIVLVTALTAMGPRRFEYCETILDEREVLAACRRADVSLSVMGTDMPWRTSTAAAAALWKDSEMTEGWMPLPRSLSAAPSKLPQMTTTEVVPSPASTSWAVERLTSILAVGCMTDMLFSMVFPSFVIIVSPLPLWIILSMPLGPREVRMASATAVRGAGLVSGSGPARVGRRYLWRRRCWTSARRRASPCPRGQVRGRPWNVSGVCMVGSGALLTLKVALELPPLGWVAGAAMVSVLGAEGRRAGGLEVWGR